MVFARGKAIVSFFHISLLVFFPLILLSCKGETEKEKEEITNKIIGITQIASHPGLDAFRNGVIEGLREKGWVENQNLEVIFKNANRDPNLTLPIAQSFVKANVDLIVPITTPSALAAAKATSSIPIVFGGVTDPAGVGLVKDIREPGGNITGTSDRWPFATSIQFFKELLPSIQSIGMLFSPGDNISEIGLREMRKLSESHAFELVERPVSSAADLYNVARDLYYKVDVIFTGMDHMIVENLDSVLKAGFEAKKPVLAGDHGSVKRGALAAMGVDMMLLGKETGYIVDRVLKGESPGDIPVFVIKTGKPLVNLKTAEQLGINIDKSVLEKTAVFE